MRESFFRFRASQSCVLRGCHVSDATSCIMCTNIASKMAPANVCKGSDTASSAILIAGYFERLIGCKRPYTGFPLTSVSKMNVFHCVHQSWSDENSCS